MSELRWEIEPMTFGKYRLIWTDGFSVGRAY
jgi:hypothetical protein